MVAISLYRGDLHKASDVPRQWLMPTPQISFKNFKLLLRRRSLALSRLYPTPASTFNLDPTPRPEAGVRVSQETTTVNSSVVVDPTVPSGPDSSVTQLKTPPLCTNPNSLAIEKSVMVDVVNEIEKTKRDVEIKLKSLNTRKHNLVKLLKQVLNAVEESRRHNPVVPIRTDTANGPPVYIPAQSVPSSGDTKRGDAEGSVNHAGKREQNVLTGQSHATAIRSSSASLRTTMDSSHKPSASAAVVASRRRRTLPSTDPTAGAGGHLSRLKLCSGAAERSTTVCGGEKGGERKERVEEIIRRKGVRVVAADMGEEMQLHAVVCARKTYDSLEKFAAKSLALALKKEFDGAYGPAWHCVVGKSFGSFVTHSVGGFVYLCMDKKIYVLLFKTAVIRAG